MPPIARRLIWAPLARRDLDSLWFYLAEVASPEVANNVYRDIMRVANLVRERPLLGRPRDEIKPGYRSIRATPFLVYYRFDDIEVRIVRILHERRSVRKALRLR